MIFWETKLYVGANGFLFDRYARGSILRGLLYLDSISVLSSLGFFLLVFRDFSVFQESSMVL